MVIDLQLREALAIHRLFGDNGPLWIAEHVQLSAHRGDTANVSRLRRVMTYLSDMQPQAS